MDKQIVINNLLVSYKQTGQLGDKALLFLHGWRSNKEVWENIVNQVIKLSRLRQGFGGQASYQVCTLDLPGFGGSQIPSSAFGVGEYAEVVKGFIEKLDLKKVIVVGHSFGGRVGIKLASKYPSVLEKLVLVDSAGFVMNQKKKNLIAAAAKIAKPLFQPKFMQGLRKKIYQTIGSEDYVATPELKEIYVKTINEDLSEDMKKISCPTLIITGENDQDTPVKFGQRMNSLVSNSTFIILPNAGHFSFVDNPDDFMSSLKQFLF